MIDNKNPSDEASAASRPGNALTEIGQQLQTQRKARGISLVEVSEHTKIGKKYLEALEEARFDVLPANTYIQGFLRAYARYLEMDDEQLLKQYKAKQAAPKSEPLIAPKGEEERQNNQPVWLPLLGMLVLAGVGAALFLLWPSANSKERLQEAAVPAVGAPAGSAITGSKPGVPGEEMTLTIKAKDKTWVTIMADGTQEPDITMSPGEERTWKARERFVLWTGNAGGVEVIFNGELQPPLGKVNEVRKEVVFERKPPEAASAANKP